MIDTSAKSEYTIETERLILSLVETDDADQLFPHMANPNVSIDMSWKPHETVNDTLEFIRSVQTGFLNGKSVTWCMRLRTDLKKIIGIFSIISISRKHRELIYNKAEIAYWIVPSYQGNGYMSEAGKAAIRFGFEKLQLNKFFVAHHSNNENSKRLILKLNFTYTHIEKQAFMKNNSWIDVAHYELLKSQYQNTEV